MPTTSAQAAAVPPYPVDRLVIGEDVLPGFALPLAELFSELD